MEGAYQRQAAFSALSNPQAYGQSFQNALKNGASYDQALIRATADSIKRILDNQVPMSSLLFKIGGDPNKAVSLIRDATMQVGIYMTPGELNLLGIIAAEASAYQRDGSFTQKIAIEMLKGNFREQAWTAASEILWKEATDRVIAHGIADVISRDAGKGQMVEAVDEQKLLSDSALTNSGETGVGLANEHTSMPGVMSQQEAIGLDEAGTEQAKEKSFENLLEKAEKGDIIEPSEQDKSYRVFQTPEEIDDFFYNDGEESSLNAHNVSKQEQWEKSLSNQEHIALTDYTGSGYYDINTFLRGTGNWEASYSDNIQRQVDGLDNAISRFELKDNIRVQRGVMNDVIDRLTLEYNIQASVSELVGKKYVEKGFSSATVLRDNRVATAKPTVLDIEIPAGKGRGAYVNRFAGQSRNTEYEFLIKRGASFTIKEVQEERFMDETYFYIRLVMDDE